MALLLPGDPFGQIAADAVLSAALTEFARAVSNTSAQPQKVDLSTTDALANFASDVEQAGAGSLASYGFAELINALGMKGITAQALDASGGAVISRIATNLVALKPWNYGLAGSAEAGVGAFIGTEIGSLILPAHSQEAALGGAFGSALGAVSAVASPALSGAIATALGVEVGSTVGNFVIPGVGALIGYAVGELIGSLFSSMSIGTQKGPRIGVQKGPLLMIGMVRAAPRTGAAGGGGRSSAGGLL